MIPNDPVRRSVRRLLPVAGVIVAHAIDGIAAVHCVNPGGTEGCFSSVQAAVNAAVAKDVIEVAAGTYPESVVIPDRAKLTIRGAGKASTLLQSSYFAGAFHSAGGGAVTKPDLAIETMTITHTASGNRGFSLDGGKLRLTGVRVTGFSQGLSLGCSSSVKALVTDAEIDGNFTAIQGCDRAKVDVVGTTIHGNAEGIRDAGAVSIARSTISGNGSGNTGALYNFRRAKVTSSTIVDNVSLSTNAAGGITGRAVVSGSVVANNVGPAYDDCHPLHPVSTRGYNVIKDTGCSFLRPSATDVVGMDPNLGALADNGGPTPTRALLAGSPALALVDNAGLCRKPDQRQVARQRPCDAGAFEAP